MQFHWLLGTGVVVVLNVIIPVSLMSNAEIMTLITVVMMPIARTTLFHMLAAF